jgi:DnaJ-class molecular chaperone
MLFGETFKNKTTTHFDDLFTQAYPRQQTTKKRGDDQSIKLELTIEEAYRGTTRKMDINISGLPPKRLEVKIPPNVREGSKIRMSGEGSPGKNGGQTGDLYLIVTLKKHPFFVIENDDINSEILITPSNAVLGTEIEVPTLDGPVKMVIPPGTQNDKMLRLRGKGMPHQKREGRGDHFVKVKINIPTVISEEEKKLYQELLKVEKRKN